MKNLLLTICFSFVLTGVAIAVPLGQSADNPGYSAKHILEAGASIGDGIYWIDPDGDGSHAAFQAYADMTTDGGGWTLGLNSLHGNESASSDMVSNTGSVSGGLTTAHTRNLTELAINQQAELRHVIDDGSKYFDQKYTGSYHDRLGTADEWTALADDNNSSGILSYHFGRFWSTATNDRDAYSANCAHLYSNQPWYYGACWTTHPTSYSNTNYPTSTNSGNPASRYSIFVRETADYSAIIAASSAAVPEPSSFLLLVITSGLCFSLKKKK